MSSSQDRFVILKDPGRGPCDSDDSSRAQVLTLPVVLPLYRKGNRGRAWLSPLPRGAWRASGEPAPSCSCCVFTTHRGIIWASVTASSHAGFIPAQAPLHS